VNAVGFLEDLCLGNVETDVPHDGLKAVQMPAVASANAGYESCTKTRMMSREREREREREHWHLPRSQPDQ